MRRLLPLLVLFAASSASAQDYVPEWTPVTDATGTSQTVSDLTDLSYEYPDSAAIRRKLLGAMLETPDDYLAGQANALAVRGYALSKAGEDAIAAALSPEDAASFRENMARNRKPVEASTVIATLPAEARLVEGVARDPVSGDLYATTVVSRALYRKHGADPWQKVALEGTGSLSGIAWDAKRKLLWVASSTFDETPGDKVFAAVLGYDPAQGRVVKTLYANGQVPLGDIAVGADGALYAANPVAGEIHRANPDSDDGFSALVGHGIFRSPQGMVPVPGTRLLIVSDYGYGLAALDMGNGKLWRVTGGKGEFLDGIDALQLYGHSLIAVQNGHGPKRILMLDMADSWLAIDTITVLESGVPDWTEPVGGTVDGDRLLYVGTGQWDRFGKGGAVAQGAEPVPTDIRAVPLGN